MTMTNEQQILLRNLKDRIDLLKSLYQSQKEANQQLARQNQILNSEIDEYKRKITILEQQYQSVKLARSVASPAEGADEAKLQIMRIVREIDECMALLNK